MKILTFSAYFTPEIAASMYLTEDMLKSFVDYGHDITLLCPTPCRGVDNETRKIYSTVKKNECLYDGHLKIKRFSLYKESDNTLLRFIRYYIFTWILFFKSIKEKPDLIFAQSTPPIIGLAIKKIKHIKNVPVIYDLQDIFPDSLVNAGMTKKGSLLWKIGRKIEDQTYKTSDKIIVISESFKKNIISKGVPENKIEVVYNWMDSKEIHPIPKEYNSLFNEFNIDKEKFNVVYSGNFGSTQGTDVIIKAAELLKENDKIQFVLFGGGALFDKSKKYIRDNHLNNVFIHELLPKDKISEIYSMADVVLITGKKGVGESSVPSKLWNIMGCNVPIIASFDFDSELSDILAESNAGVCAEPENEKALVDAIITIMNNKNFNNNRQRDFAIQYASRNICLKKINDCIYKTVERKQ